MSMSGSFKTAPHPIVDDHHVNSVQPKEAHNEIGIGLPAAVPGIDATIIGPWAPHGPVRRSGAGGVPVRLLETIGVTDLVLYPCTSDIDQVSAVADALGDVRSPLQAVTP